MGAFGCFLTVEATKIPAEPAVDHTPWTRSTIAGQREKEGPRHLQELRQVQRTKIMHNYVESSFDLIIKVMVPVDTIHSNIEPEKIKTKFKNLKPKKPENKNPVICIHNQVRGGVIEPTEDLRVDNDGTSVGTKITEEAT